MRLSSTPYDSDRPLSRRHCQASSHSRSSSQSPSSAESPLSSAALSSSSPSNPPILISLSVPLPVFRGLPGECPAAHLSQFSRLFRQENSDPARNFPLSLAGDAALWHDLAVEADPSISVSWDEAKSAFLRAFARPESPRAARADLASLQQRRGESSVAYRLRMQGILQRWPEEGLPESLLKALFVDGLREELRDRVAVLRPETLAEALGMAMDCERAVAARTCGFCEEAGHGETECEARKEMRDEWMRRRRAKPAEEGRMERVGSIGRRSQCQCGKHRCSKKYERSTSTLTARDGNTAGDADAARPLELE